MYTLKSIARRGTTLGMAVGLLVAAFVPTASVFADALNPLTERSLMLSSSSPGYTDTDGSGNPTYAPPGSGPNGRQTGETFKFKVSSAGTVRGLSFQYCTSAAGWCQGPGDNTGDADPNNDGNPADSTRESNATAHPLGRSDLDFEGAFTDAGNDAIAPGEFQVTVNGDESAAGWTFTKARLENTQHTHPGGGLTGKNNYITLTSSTGETLAVNDVVEVVFRASATNYITNPGSGAFFVKINTYNSDTSLVGNHNDGTPLDNEDSPSHTVIDGGVTVANVMTDSIHITTKVLETMSFSVGTRNRDAIQINCTPVSVTTGCEGASGNVYGTCAPIQNINNNRLNLGNPDAEYSLETNKGWSVNSYWRLSSNSSGGATVYYSGNTLANTVGDSIKDMPTESVSTPGTEQFGLGFVPVEAPHADYVTENPGRKINSYPFKTLATQTGVGFEEFDDLPLQDYTAEYDEADGTLDNGGSPAGPGTAKFKFDKNSLTIPEPIAQQNDQVIACATAKMRYVGNIGADTPAGVYTTKINYLAAPQY